MVKHTIYSRYPEINYVLIKLEDAEYMPYVAGFNYDEEYKCWGQGHYFRTYQEARDYIKQKYVEKFENVNRLEPEYSALDYSDDGSKVLIAKKDGSFSQWLEYELNMDTDIPEDVCCRVRINDEYYYFG